MFVFWHEHQLWYLWPKKITTGKKVQSSGRLCFLAGLNYNWKKLRPEKKGTVVWPSVGNWKKLRAKKKGKVIWSSVGAQNTKHNTHHRHNNQQHEPCHPTLQRLCSLSLHGWSSGAAKSWRRRSPTPRAGHDPSGLRSLSLVCLLGKAKWCVCVFLASGYKTGTVMHEIPISSPPSWWHPFHTLGLSSTTHLVPPRGGCSHEKVPTSP